MDSNPKVFCSHRSVDKPRVREIAEKLADDDVDPWVDQWEIAPGAIYGGPKGKPTVAPPKTRTRQRTFRIVLRSAKPGEIAVLAEIDGQAVAPEQETRLGADFVFSRGSASGSAPNLFLAFGNSLYGELFTIFTT